jgi:hypothetical protein
LLRPVEELEQAVDQQRRLDLFREIGGKQRLRFKDQRRLGAEGGFQFGESVVHDAHNAQSPPTIRASKS